MADKAALTKLAVAAQRLRLMPKKKMLHSGLLPTKLLRSIVKN